jgi:phosphohistidine phosphatase
LVLIYLCYNRPMKMIYLIRHAKSDWNNPSLDDIDRGLSKRGKKSIPIMAIALKEKNIKPDLILSSPAKRAKLTIKKLLKELGLKDEIIYEDSLYMADPDTILSIINEINDKANSIFIVGHNPGLTEFANLIDNKTIGNIPTLGIIALKYKIKKWKECKYHKSRVEFFIYPKMF